MATYLLLLWQVLLLRNNELRNNEHAGVRFLDVAAVPANVGPR